MRSNFMLHRLAVVCFLVSLAMSLSAQVVYDNNAQCTGSNLASNLLSLANFTVPASSQSALVVLTRGSETRTVSSVTFNGQSLFRLGDVVSNSNARAEIWYRALGNLAVPLTSNIEVVWNASMTYRMITVLSAHNVDQITPLNNLTSNGFPIGATSSSITVSGTSGDLAVEAISSIGDVANPPVFTPTSGQTQLPSCTSQPISSFRQSAAYKAQTGSTSLGWTISSISQATTNGIQIGANIRANTILPVELLHFQVYSRDHVNVLHWETATEHNSHYFEVQHSNNGGEFKAIGNVTAAGNSTKIINYTFQHDHPATGPHYYRLKSVDQDGRFLLSPIVSVLTGKETTSIAVYPNPTQHTIKLRTADRHQATRLYNAQGKVVFQSIAVPVEIDMTGLPKGFYVLKIGAAWMKVVKE